MSAPKVQLRTALGYDGGKALEEDIALSQHRLARAASSPKVQEVLDTVRIVYLPGWECTTCTRGFDSPMELCPLCGEPTCRDCLRDGSHQERVPCR